MKEYKIKRRTNIFAGNMIDTRMSIEEERHPEQPLNEEGNLRDGELWVDLMKFRKINLNLKGL